MSAALRNPQRNLVIAAALAAGGAASVLSGVLLMTQSGVETPLSAALIGVGAVAGVVGLLMAFNFAWGVRVVNAMRRGEGVIARWTVPATTFDEFRAAEAALAANGRANDYRLPRRTPPDGVDIVFSADGVLIGDTYFGLASTGLARFGAVHMVPGNPLSLAFATALTVSRTGAAGVRLATQTGELRVPVARTANDGARAVLAHYAAVAARQTIVKPGFWTFRLRLGLWSALIASLVCAAGLGLNALKVDLGMLPLLMAVGGAVAAPGGLILALLAWRLREDQHGARRGGD